MQSIYCSAVGWSNRSLASLVVGFLIIFDTGFEANAALAPKGNSCQKTLLMGSGW